MRRHLVAVIVLPAIVLASAVAAHADSWLFQPSTFSHNPVTGERVNQYAPKQPAYVRSDPSYRESGYRHSRYSIFSKGSADRLHVVQTWGAGEMIRPYGEWEYPYRPGATPYGPWGNPQGPWTTPYDSWINPYGQWNRFPYPPGYGYGLIGPGQGPAPAPPSIPGPMHPPGMSGHP